MDRIVWLLSPIAACGGATPPVHLPEPPPAKSNAFCGVVDDTTTHALLAGVEVEAEIMHLWEAPDHPPDLAPVVTDDRGRFCISSLPVGEYELTFSRPGYKEVWLRGVVVLDRGVSIRVDLLPNIVTVPMHY